MKKLLLIFALFTLRACEPIPAMTTTNVQDEWVVSVAVSEDGQHRAKIRYAIDFAGRVALYQGVYVESGGYWIFATCGKDEDGQIYVNWMGQKYFF